MSIIGYNTIGASEEVPGFSNHWISTKFTCPADGVVNSIFARINDSGWAGDAVELGIYSDIAGEPGIFLGSGQFTISLPSPTEQWFEAILSSPVFVYSGTDYWLTYQENHVTGYSPYIKFDAGSVNQSRYTTINYVSGIGVVPPLPYWDNNPVTSGSNNNKYSIYANIIPIYNNKFINNGYAYILSDTNPAQLIKVDISNPTIYTKYTITGKKNGKNIFINNARNTLYASLNEGHVAKYDLSDLSIFTGFYVGESNQLNTITHNPNYLTTFVGDNVSGLTEFIIDEAEHDKINTDLRFLLEETKTLNTYFSTLNAGILNTDLRTLVNVSDIISTDLRFNKYSYVDTNIYPLAREDFHVYIDAVQLGDDDLKLDSIQIVHTIDAKSTARFILLRKHDAINTPTTITANNVVTIYLGNKLEFTGKITNLDCSSQDETITVSCESDINSTDYDSSINKDLPLTVLNTQLHLYDVLLNNITIDNPILDTRLIIISDGGLFWTGTAWNRNITLALTFVDFSTASSYIENNTDDSFIKGNPQVDNYERNPKYYRGIRVNLGTKTEENVSGWYSLSNASINAKEITDGTFKFNSGFTYFWKVNVILYDLPTTTGISSTHTIIPHVTTQLNAYIGTSLSSLSSDLYEITAVYYRYQKILDDIVTDLGYYSTGTAPFKEISSKNGIKIAKARWVDKTDGLYWDKGISYDYEQYTKDVADVEYTKVQNINGDITPRTSANIDLTIDGYLYYNLKLLNRINLINTTITNTYKNSNGFPISIKQINVDSNSMKVSISCDNEYSQIEIDLLDVIYDNAPEEQAETSIKLCNKFDLAYWEDINA